MGDIKAESLDLLHIFEQSRTATCNVLVPGLPFYTF